MRPERLIEVDGETFRVSVHGRGIESNVEYIWLSGKNPGHGFGGSNPSGRLPSDEEAKAEARRFLALVNPETGYIDD